MSSARRREQRLTTLWRLRQLELEQARIERAGLEAVADRQRRRVAQMRREVDETRELERVRVTAETGVTADLLRGARAYAAWQIRGVVEQEAALLASERVAEQSRLEVGRRFERLEVIQRLRDRNAREAATEQHRYEQRALDDQALIRASMLNEAARERGGGRQPWP